MEDWKRPPTWTSVAYSPPREARVPQTPIDWSSQHGSEPADLEAARYEWRALLMVQDRHDSGATQYEDWPRIFLRYLIFITVIIIIIFLYHRKVVTLDIVLYFLYTLLRFMSVQVLSCLRLCFAISVLSFAVLSLNFTSVLLITVTHLSRLILVRFNRTSLFRLWQSVLVFTGKHRWKFGCCAV